MKITDAIARLLRELQTGGDVDVTLETPADKCAAHGGRQPCPYCDLCNHGKALTQHCEDCAAVVDWSWLTAPISDDEIDRFEAWFSGYRDGPLRERYIPRVYISKFVKLGPLFARELRRLRALESATKAGAVDPHADSTGNPPTRVTVSPSDQDQTETRRDER